MEELRSTEMHIGRSGFWKVCELVSNLFAKQVRCQNLVGSNPTPSAALYCKVASQAHNLGVLCESGMRHHLGFLRRPEVRSNWRVLLVWYWPLVRSKMELTLGVRYLHSPQLSRANSALGQTNHEVFGCQQ